jgi:hypothetical protein
MFAGLGVIMIATVGLFGLHLTAAAERRREAERKREVDGQVLISARDGVSYRLGSVPVRVYHADTLKAHVLKQMATFDALMQRAKEIRHDVDAEFNRHYFSRKKLRNVALLTSCGERVDPWLVQDLFNSGFPESESRVVDVVGAIAKLAEEGIRIQAGLFLVDGLAKETSTDADGNFQFAVNGPGDYEPRPANRG